MELHFDNRFIAQLPGDAEDGLHVRQVHGAVHTRLLPTPVSAPRLIAHSAEVAAELGFDASDVQSGEFARVFGGNALLDGMQPWAANYGGHQFGHWAGQLGDGRAISLGEAITASGERRELQLKGAGPTPYSRGADGRAVLRSSIREFLCSEAMHHLGVPTTRALSLVATGEQVVRDMFYDGHAQAEPGAIVCRVAPSFIRFGSFELPSARGDGALLERLIDFTIARDFAHITGKLPQQRDAWFIEVCERTARMIAEWMRVGFVHGVMNTDNLSITGITLDYGPYGWIDDFDPDWTPNTTDAQHRRYRFGQQMQVGWWNLSRLASALAPAFASHDALHAGLQRYEQVFAEADRANIAAKLGLRACRDEDIERMRALHVLLETAEVDMTIFFRRLADVDMRDPDVTVLREAFYDERKMHAGQPDFMAWMTQLAARVREDDMPAGARRAGMNRVNPRYVLRNYLVQQVIERAGQGDEAGIAELLEVMRRPYDEQSGNDVFAKRRPDWARHRAGCSMLSCSS